MNGDLKAVTAAAYMKPSQLRIAKIISSDTFPTVAQKYPFANKYDPIFLFNLGKFILLKSG